jgi:hypothetical protein
MRTRFAMTSALGAAVMLVATVGGCSADPPTPTPSPPAPSPVLRVVTTDFPDLSGRQALLEGTLTADDDGCVHAKTSGDLVALVWPRGYTVAGDPGSFEIRNAQGDVVARSGSPLSMGGGVTDTVNEAWGDADCATGALWVVGESQRADPVGRATSRHGAGEGKHATR